MNSWRVTSLPRSRRAGRRVPARAVVRGTQFIVTFNTEFTLPADHYFFVPQVEVLNGKGEFLWASAPHPQFTGDLQQWVRNSNLDPDWLRVGTDIVGGTTFNGSFSLFGEVFLGP